MKLPAELLEDFAFNALDKTDEIEVVQRNYIDSGRWTEHWEMIFTYEGHYYKASYELPATEMQEGIGPFEYSMDMQGNVECPEVFPHTKTVIIFKEAE